VPPATTRSNSSSAQVGGDASSGQQQIRHRLSRAGNRRINRTLHIMAIVQLCNGTEGGAHYDAKKAAGKTLHGSDVGAQATTVQRRQRMLADQTNNAAKRQARVGTPGRL